MFTWNEKNILRAWACLTFNRTLFSLAGWLVMQTKEITDKTRAKIVVHGSAIVNLQLKTSAQHFIVPLVTWLLVKLEYQVTHLPKEIWTRCGSRMNQVMRAFFPRKQRLLRHYSTPMNFAGNIGKVNSCWRTIWNIHVSRKSKLKVGDSAFIQSSTPLLTFQRCVSELYLSSLSRQAIHLHHW